VSTTSDLQGRRYDVVLTGDLLPGRHIDDVVRAVADFYGADESHVARLFAAAPRICKRNLSSVRAQRHVKALRRAGALAELAARPAGGSVPDEPSDPAGAASAEPVVRDRVAPADGAVPDSRREGAAAAPAAGSPRAAAAPPEAADTGTPAAAAAFAHPPPEPRGRPAPCPARRFALLGLLAGFALGTLAAWWALPSGQRGADAPAGGGRTASPAARQQSGRTAVEAGQAAAAEVSPAGRPAPASGEGPGAVSGVAVATVDAPNGGDGGADGERGDGPTSARTEVAPAAAGRGPFGLSAGTPLSALDVVADAPAPGRKVLGAVPRPVPGVDRVVALVTPGVGLCGIDAQRGPLPTAADGAALRAAFADVELALDRRYGAHRRTNIRLSRTAPDAEQTWMRGLLAGERALSSAWVGDAQTPLADDLERVMLTAVADAEDRGSLSIAYRFHNHGACAAELSGESGSGSDAD
jgi:hypothetical protein